MDPIPDVTPDPIPGESPKPVSWATQDPSSQHVWLPACIYAAIAGCALTCCSKYGPAHSSDGSSQAAATCSVRTCQHCMLGLLRRLVQVPSLPTFPSRPPPCNPADKMCICSWMGGTGFYPELATKCRVSCSFCERYLRAFGNSMLELPAAGSACWIMFTCMFPERQIAKKVERSQPAHDLGLHNNTLSNASFP